MFVGRFEFWLKLSFVALVIISLFAFAANPFANLAYTDSAVFYYVGEGMTRGLLPYRDMFDHKGLLIYFFNWLGASLGCGLTGVWIVESFLFLGTIFSAYRFLKRQFTSSSVIVSLIMFVWFFFKISCGGNMTETYATYFITFAWLLLNDDIATGRLSGHSSFCVGLALGVVSMLRPDMIGLSFPYVIYLCVCTISKRKWRQLSKHLVISFFGVMVVFLPCLCYAMWHGILTDMYQCYIDFNLRYAAANTRVYEPTCWLAGFIVMVNVVAYIIDRTRCRMVFYNAVFSAATFLLVVLKMRYEHYFIPMSSCLLIPVCIIAEQIWLRRMRLCAMIALSLVVANFLIYSVAGTNFDFMILRQMMCGKSVGNGFLRRNSLAGLDAFNDHIKKGDSVLVWGNDCLVYHRLGSYSRNRYFYQTVMKFDDKIRKAVEESLAWGLDHYLISARMLSQDCVLQNYRICARSGRFLLWRYSRGGSRPSDGMFQEGVN